MDAKTLDSDILILGSGGAGLFAALHAHKAAPELSITVAVKGLLGKCGCTRMVPTERSSTRSGAVIVVGNGSRSGAIGGARNTRSSAPI